MAHSLLSIFYQTQSQRGRARARLIVSPSCELSNVSTGQIWHHCHFLRWRRNSVPTAKKWVVYCNPGGGNFVAVSTLPKCRHSMLGKHTKFYNMVREHIFGLEINSLRCLAIKVRDWGFQGISQRGKDDFKWLDGVTTSSALCNTSLPFYFQS